MMELIRIPIFTCAFIEINLYSSDLYCKFFSHKTIACSEVTMHDVQAIEMFHTRGNLHCHVDQAPMTEQISETPVNTKHLK